MTAGAVDRMLSLDLRQAEGTFTVGAFFIDVRFIGASLFAELMSGAQFIEFDKAQKRVFDLQIALILREALIDVPREHTEERIGDDRERAQPEYREDKARSACDKADERSCDDDGERAVVKESAEIVAPVASLHKV